MDLRYITCSGANEENYTAELVSLGRLSDKVEIGIVTSQHTMRANSVRNKWFNQILRENIQNEVNLAMHIGGDWCTDFCNGKIAPELKQWLAARKYATNRPAIPRWQLNIGNGMNLRNENEMAAIIADYPDNEFIFSFNDNPLVVSYISRLYDTGVPFSLLFDSSYGTGRSPVKWETPRFAGHAHGYAGGLSGENVAEQLTRISNVIPFSYNTWIDAEFKLKKPGTMQFDTRRAETYVRGALNWLRGHGRQM